MLIDDIKLALRITTNALDGEVNDLILAAKEDLQLSGVAAAKIVDDDPLIKRAVIVYCKANFGLNNPDSEKYQKSYDMIKTHLVLSGEYAEVMPAV